ncbi:MAG: UDP-N-acetylmuramoyl-L-alanyl-D-glutamate--2,6-diaminopimelate ligase [Candidatus Moranbacteria bacterium]|nr:UDP-N-acetylmuramoyl-L-alanyl-D-glutamate--2,6-diaminopimelate ligase [Candidatus Moranbacteria bacterium]
MKKLIPQSIKNIYHLMQAIFANIAFGFPSKKLKVIGVTGTNGKTTTVQMTAKILEENGSKIAVASTINFKIAEKEWVNESKFTTLSSWKLEKFLRQAVRAGCEYAVLEISSHSLDQNRVWGVDFLVAAITNITREHLDYHKTMEKYAKAKEKLFAIVSQNKNGASVVNMDMQFAENFLKYPARKKYGYFLESQNPNCVIGKEIETVIARDIKLDIQNTRYKISGFARSGEARQNSKFSLNLPGEFNIENALAATCIGLSQGIALEKIAEALGKIKGVPGRMERIENGRGIEIIVDYAVTPDSLEKLYNLIDSLKENDGKKDTKVIAVFGSCGDRDRGKRPIMGEIVARYADYCIVTNEDPYSEDPVRIINEVFSGVIGKDSQGTETQKLKLENENAWRILDRREAIKKALQLAKPGDIVVVTGKGAEEVMVVGGKRIPWNDPKVIREVLVEM